MTFLVLSLFCAFTPSPPPPSLPLSLPVSVSLHLSVVTNNDTCWFVRSPRGRCVGGRDTSRVCARVRVCVSVDVLLFLLFPRHTLPPPPPPSTSTHVPRQYRVRTERFCSFGPMSPYLQRLSSFSSAVRHPMRCCLSLCLSSRYPYPLCPTPRFLFSFVFIADFPHLSLFVRIMSLATREHAAVA